MRRSLKHIVFLGLILGLARYGMAQGLFEAGFDCDTARIEAPAGATVSADCRGMLTSNAGSEPGAQGWSLSMTTDGCSIVDVTIVGTAAEASLTGGFQVTELTENALATNPEAGCPDGSQGAVSAVVLNLVSGATLNPAESPHDIFIITVEGQAPGDPGTCETCSIFYLDGCEGSGEPVAINVTREGASVTPDLADTAIELCAEVEPESECENGEDDDGDTLVDCEDPDCANAPPCVEACPLVDAPGTVQVNIQTEVVDEDGFGLAGETSELFAAVVDPPDAPLNEETAVVEASPGELTIFAAMVSNGLENGVQGWSISGPVDESGGAELIDVTIQGTAAGKALTGGFQVTELTKNATANPDAGCPGTPTGHGVVSAVVLDLVAGTTLQTTGTASALAMTFAGDQDESALLSWQDGCEGSGEPVANVATISGGSSSFACGQPVIVSFAEPPPPPICPIPGAGVQVIAQTEVVDEDGYGLFGETSELLAAQADTPDPEAPALVEAGPGEVVVYAAIVSDGLENGVQGWSISGPVDESGGAELIDVTINGTAAQKALAGGFQVTELTKNATTNPDAGCPGTPTGHGVVSAVVLDLVAGTTLQTTGTATALALTFAGDQDESALLSWEDGCEGSGEPVANVATIQGGSASFACLQSVTVSFSEPPPPPVSDYIRCDPNNDGKVNLADAIWIVNELFRGGPATACPAAADCNADGSNDLSDALFAVGYLFGGGTMIPDISEFNPGAMAPPAPFPDCGGKDMLEDPAQCPVGSTVCP